MKKLMFLIMNISTVLLSFAMEQDERLQLREQQETAWKYIDEHNLKENCYKTSFRLLEAIAKKDISEMNAIIKDFPAQARSVLLNGLLDVHYVKNDYSKQRAYPHLYDCFRTIINADGDKLTSLTVAVVAADEKILEALFEYGFHIDVDKGFPLQIAVEANPRAIPFLIQKGANGIDIILNYAVDKNNFPAVQELVKAGASLKKRKRNILDRAPLHFACDKGHYEIVKLFLKKGALVDETDQNGQTPLHLAVEHGDFITADLLLEHGANVNIRDSMSQLTPWNIVAFRKNDDKIANLFLERGAFVDEANQNGQTPLHWAVEHSSFTKVNLLLEHGANILAKHKDGRTVIECISEPARWRAMELLKQGAPYPITQFHQGMLGNFGEELKGSSPFYQHYFRALIKGNTKEILAALAQAKDNEINQGTPPMNGLAALHWAVLQNNREVLEVLIRISNSKRNKNMRTFASKIPLVSWYVRHPVNINCRDDQGRTPLMWAARLGYTHIYRDLIRAGAKVAYIDKKGKMALNYAADYRNIDIIREMIIDGTLSAKSVTNSN